MLLCRIISTQEQLFALVFVELHEIPPAVCPVCQGPFQWQARYLLCHPPFLCHQQTHHGAFCPIVWIINEDVEKW